MKLRITLAVIGGAAGVVSLTTCGACGAIQDKPDGSIGPPDARADVADVQTEPAGCYELPRPSYVPAGWVAWDAFAPCSGFYIPTDASQLPPPFEWIDCANASPAIAGCRMINNPLPGPTPTILTDAALDANGHVIVIASDLYADHSLQRVGDADGAMSSAFMSVWGSSKYYGYSARVALVQSVTPPRYIAEVIDRFQQQIVGWLGGTVDKSAPYLADKLTIGSAYTVGDPGVLAVPQPLRLFDFDSGVKALIISSGPQDNGLVQVRGRFYKRDLFWQLSGARTDVVGAWFGDDAGTGVDFIDYRPDSDHAAGDLGTDGSVMVWLEGHGPATTNAFWTSADWWVAPFVTDKSLLQPRRLRSEIPNAVASGPIAVGCGVAALETGLGGRIVRLADGYSTMLANGQGWDWGPVLAVNCNEIFLQVGYKGMLTLGRLPIASIPFADPPD